MPEIGTVHIKSGDWFLSIESFNKTDLTFILICTCYENILTMKWVYILGIFHFFQYIVV